ncbi:class I SAM-dependent methyltransferase [Bacillus shivajii]|uniref:class I SAM-dependent methyltransferase n=1 Tax=Bacillus shivajii TaxID=1983719 RepID=UPI001CFB68BB|nr:class I SAM-dependent methyltransferase [Bacillus shivajii]UCZ53567.1 class I SAM-dependent methyltransferase [Bacillus shivajii]
MAGHRFNPEKAERLLDPKRKELIDSEWVADLLALPAEGNAADLGAGNGYFTLPLAERTKGEVYAVDVEPEMLGMLGVRATEQGFENVGFIEADLEEIPLADECVDSIVAAFVMHEVDDRVKAFHEIKRMLRDGGKAAIVEWARVEGEVGPPLHERLAPEELKKDIESAGLKVNETFETHDVYTILVEK